MAAGVKAAYSPTIPAMGGDHMHRVKEPTGKRKPALSSSETEFRAIDRLLSNKATREETRTAVRLLLRQASKSLDRSA